MTLSNVNTLCSTQPGLRYMPISLLNGATDELKQQLLNGACCSRRYSNGNIGNIAILCLIRLRVFYGNQFM